MQTLLKGEYDRNDAIITLHAGAGGTEAMDWVQMLLRMFTRWAENNDYQTRILDMLEGEEAGIKSVTVEVTGENAYGFLKSEKEFTAWLEYPHLTHRAEGIHLLHLWRLCL